MSVLASLWYDLIAHTYYRAPDSYGKRCNSSILKNKNGNFSFLLFLDGCKLTATFAFDLNDDYIKNSL